MACPSKDAKWGIGAAHIRNTLDVVPTLQHLASNIITSGISKIDSATTYDARGFPYLDLHKFTTSKTKSTSFNEGLVIAAYGQSIASLQAQSAASVSPPSHVAKINAFQNTPSSVFPVL